MRVASLFLVGAANAYTITNGGQFMLKNIDPIVFPSQYNKSHMHTFVGSDAVLYSTTTSAQLRKGCTSTENPNDLSVYWMPTLVVKNGGNSYTPVPFSRFSAYYDNIDKAQIPFPENLKLVAGNAAAKTAAEAQSGSPEWFCEGDAAIPGKAKSDFPTKTCSTHLQHILWFPDCVNPSTLAYGYHVSASACPAGMQRIPQLRFSIRYDLRKVLPGGWNGAPPLELACGPSHCTHGDFINGWEAESAKKMLSATSGFVGIDGPRGGPYDGGNCTPKDRDPTHGTSNYAESLKYINRRSIEQSFEA